MDGYRCVVINDSFGEHAGDSLAAAVAPMSARSHYASALAAVFLECSETSRNVEFAITATATVGSLNHHYNWLVRLVVFCQHLF